MFYNPFSYFWGEAEESLPESEAPVYLQELRSLRLAQSAQADDWYSFHRDVWELKIPSLPRTFDPDSELYVRPPPRPRFQGLSSIVYYDPATRASLPAPAELVIPTLPALSDEGIGAILLHKGAFRWASDIQHFLDRQPPPSHSNHPHLTSGPLHGSSHFARPPAVVLAQAQADLAACRDVVPAVFFSPLFRLSDAACLSDPASTTPPAERKQREAQLAGWLEKCEGSLDLQLAARSHCFFSCARTISSVSVQVAAALNTLTTARAKIRQLHARAVQPGESLLRRQRRLGNARRVLALLAGLSHALQTQLTAQQLAASGDFTAALALTQQMRAAVSAGGALSGLTCLERLPQRLDELADGVAQLLVTRIDCLSFTLGILAVYTGGGARGRSCADPPRLHLFPFAPSRQY
jgi:hypothetical protein